MIIKCFALLAANGAVYPTQACSQPRLEFFTEQRNRAVPMPTDRSTASIPRRKKSHSSTASMVMFPKHLAWWRTRRETFGRRPPAAAFIDAGRDTRFAEHSSNFVQTTTTWAQETPWLFHSSRMACTHAEAWSSTRREPSTGQLRTAVTLPVPMAAAWVSNSIQALGWRRYSTGFQVWEAERSLWPELFATLWIISTGRLNSAEKLPLRAAATASSSNSTHSAI